jgi:hypothetical protein
MRAANLKRRVEKVAEKRKAEKLGLRIGRIRTNEEQDEAADERSLGFWRCLRSVRVLTGVLI